MADEDDEQEEDIIEQGDDDDAPPSDGDGEDGDGDGEKKKKLSKKLIIILAAAAVILVGGLVAMFVLGVFSSSPEDEHATSAEQAEHDATEGGDGEGEHKDATPDIGVVFHDLPDFLVNLNTDGKRTKFLKVTVTLEINDAQSLEIVKAHEPRIVDNFQIYLRETTSIRPKRFRWHLPPAGRVASTDQ